ncbi:MAG TPA: hypothetical protein VEW71_02075 [Allosphingosinicella sp.]|nr:hypothetical protein [Allosphingosinicella sp.]
MEERHAHFIKNELVLPMTVIDPDERSPGGDRPSPLKHGFARLMLCGKLTSAGADHRLIIEFKGRLLGSTVIYNSFAKADGSDGSGEWETGGIYIGRNAWRRDSRFSGDIGISVNAKTARIITAGLTSFAFNDDRMIGYQTHGIEEGISDVTEVRVRALTKTVIEGFGKLLLFPVPAK